MQPQGTPIWGALNGESVHFKREVQCAAFNAFIIFNIILMLASYFLDLNVHFRLASILITVDMVKKGVNFKVFKDF